MKFNSRWRFLPELILIVAGLILGLSLFRNYGASWDEPDLYRYAAQSLQAYSIRDRMEGQFSLDSLLGPDNLRLYGPAYLVFGQLIVNLLQTIVVSFPTIDLWHLINFLFFIPGVLLFYRLLNRWFSPVTSFITVSLFASQPVVFGISWIDPKDIPFMVLFIASIYFGIILVDKVDTILKTQIIYKDSATGRPVPKYWINIFNISSGILTILSVAGWVFKQYIVNSLQQTILGMNSRLDGDLVLRAFNFLANNRESIPLQTYSEKAVSIFSSSLSILSVVTLSIGLLTISFWIFPAWISRLGFFTGSILKIVFTNPSKSSVNWNMIGWIFIAGLVLGITTSTRVLGPMAGLLIAVELFRRVRWKSLPVIFFYALAAIVVTFISWPYLWQNTTERFFEVFFHMAENPVGVGVLFRGVVYDSKQLPVDYLPWLMAVTLTIPAVLTGLAGFVLLFVRFWKKMIPTESWLMCAWFLIPFGYVLITRPPMYDNYRHFLFILPPFFFLCAATIDRLMSLNHVWIKAVIALLLVIPGISGIALNHPYEYSYYNELAGGIKGAAGKYELDYWLTCYRELTIKVNHQEEEADNIFVAFIPDLVRYYADNRFQVFKANDPSYPPESLIFLPIRREGLTLYSDLPVAFDVQHDGVTFCAARRVAR